MPKTPLSVHSFPKVLTITATGTIDSWAKCPVPPTARGSRSASTLFRFSSSPRSTLSGRCYPSRLCVASRRFRTLGARASLPRDPGPESPSAKRCVAIEAAHLLGDVVEALSADTYLAPPLHRSALTCEDMTTTAVARFAR